MRELICLVYLIIAIFILFYIYYLAFRYKNKEKKVMKTSKKKVYKSLNPELYTPVYEANFYDKSENSKLPKGL